MEKNGPLAPSHDGLQLTAKALATWKAWLAHPGTIRVS
jgi:hypothetical protein